MSTELKQEEISLLQKSISIEFVKSDFSSLIPNNDFERMGEFRQYLTERIKDMLDNNYNLLINTLYRIDINEQKVGMVFATKDKVLIPEKLADLIIERQVEKINYRKRYRDGQL
jgi:hypothetical protein